MKGFGVLLQKEWREQIRNFKLLWIPLVFIIFGILEPVTNHFLPEIMKSVGNMPEGVEFPWPEFAPKDILVSLMGQYQSIGLLIIVLAFIGAISSERKSGTATLLYVRPLSYSSYFLSKWTMINALVLFSVWVGFLAGWYYTSQLFGSIPATDVVAFLAAYSLWIIFAVSIVLALSAWLPTGGVAALGLFLTMIMAILDSVIGAYWTVTPWKLSTYASYILMGSMDYPTFWKTAGLTVFLIILLILFGTYMAGRNAAKTTV
ncbi:ABC-2 type transport system permease protein [Sporosarcina luteola]|nr:ABC-2 type transport system permease protein [Sporosarcina luteola]